MISALIAGGHVSGAFAGRPPDCDDPDVLKVMVIMTDGENFGQWMLHEPFKTGPSDVWRNPADDRLSLFHAGRPAPNRHYVPHNNYRQDRPTAGRTGRGARPRPRISGSSGA